MPRGVMASAKVKSSEPNAIGLITEQTFLKIFMHDKSGKGITLYCFYALKCLDQNTTQPLVSDRYTAERLTWNKKTVQTYRNLLKSLALIKMIRKGKIFYMRVSFLPFSVTNELHGAFDTRKIPATVMSTYGVFEYYKVWIDRIYEKPARFINAVRKKYGPETKDNILGALHEVYDNRICTQGYGIQRVDCELSFFHYLLVATVNKLDNNGYPGDQF